MSLRVESVRFGRDAACTLRDRIAAAQAEDPLAPVTVVVPRNVTGLGVRRLLASGDLGPAPSADRVGVCNVRFTTVARLAEEIASSDLAADPLLPATPAVLHGVARRVLDQLPGGLLTSVREHPGTVRALGAAHRDLAGIQQATRRRLARSGALAGEVVEAVEAMEALLSPGWSDEGERISRAIAVLNGAGTDGAGTDGADNDGPGTRTGTDAPTDGKPDRSPVIVYLPHRLSRHDEQFIEALASVRPVSILVGTTGDRIADATARATVARLGPSEPAVDGDDRRGGPYRTTLGTDVLSAPNADAEIRAVLRLVMERRRAGTRFERIAVAHAGVGPYPRLVTESLEAAGIPFSGVAQHELASTMPARILLGLLDLYERGWRRDEVVAWCAAGPVLGTDGHPVPATDWDLLSREAGVTAGAPVWRSRLVALREAWTVSETSPPAHAAAPAGPLPRTGRSGQSQGEPAHPRESHELLTGLVGFFDELTGWFADPPRTWAGWAAWAVAVLDRYLGRPSRRHDPWPSREEEALDAVRTAVESLAVLDRFGGPVDRMRFRQALDLELGAPAPQTTRFGTGVFVGPVGMLVGLDFDVVFVVGMVDGAYPRREHDDPLLSDEARMAAGPELPLSGTASQDAWRDYLAALATAPERVLTYARGDQRQGGEQRPARWLLDTLSAIAGGDRRLSSRDVEELPPRDGYRRLPSFTSVVRSDGEPMSLGDRDLRTLLRWSDAGGAPSSCWLTEEDARLRTGLVVQRERRRRGLTRFDGRAGARSISSASPTAGSTPALSPTSLERYAACPRQYLMERILRVDVPDRPEDVLAIQPREQGQLVHAVLQQFLEDQVALPRAQRIRPGTAWSDEDHERLDAVADQMFGRYEALGLVGRPVTWELDRATIRADLHRFLREDDAYRAAGGWVPERVEWAFGDGDRPGVELVRPDGRPVAFKGVVDRVDRRVDGGLSVIDYKTGSSAAYRSVPTDPLSRGGTLQLPVYGLAAWSSVADGLEQERDTVPLGPPPAERTAAPPSSAAPAEGSPSTGRTQGTSDGFSVPVEVGYWFASSRGEFRRISYPLDGSVVGRLGEVVGVLAGGIEAGLFPARPGEGRAHCRRCGFEALCPGDREGAWSRVREDADLRAYVALTEGAEGAEGAEG